MMNEFDYEQLKEEGIFIRDGKVERFSRVLRINQYFHRKKLILKTKKNDYG